MENVFLTSSYVKKRLFGSSYLEGLWVGYYKGSDDKLQFYIESFEQDFDGLVIGGRCFHEDKSFKGTWTSERVIIDAEKGKIAYTYVTEMIHNSYKNQGLAEFVFDRENKRESPKRIVGFSSDVFSEKKVMSIEEKIIVKKKLTESELLERAIEVYKNNERTY